MFIDIHVHTRSIPGFGRNGKASYATPEQLLQRYDEIGVEQAVILPGVNPECAYVPQSNEEVLQIAQKHPDRFIAFCNVDPRALTNSSDAGLDEILRYYRDKGCRGLGEVCANMPFLHPLIQNLFGAAQSVGLPLVFHVATQIGHTYGIFDDPGLPQLEATLARFPELVLLGHSQPFWAEIAELQTVGERSGYPSHCVQAEGAVPKLMRKYPNLHGDLSAGSGHNALARDEEYAARFLDEFQDRLLFGTDICAPDTPTPLVDLLKRMLKKGAISQSVFDKVARENARRLLRL